MKTRIYLILILIFLFAFFISNAQNYYYYNNQKVYLEMETEFVSVNGINNQNYLDNYSNNYISKTEFNELYVRSYMIPTDENARGRVNLKNYYCEIKVIDNIKNNSTKYTNFINELNNDPYIIKASPCFKSPIGKRIGLTNYFYVKIHSISDENILYNYAKNYNLEVIGRDPHMPNWYIVSCNKNNPLNSLEYSNLFYESGLFETAEPEFVFHENLATNDELYPIQWNLKNTGQFNPNYPDIDINVEPAWEITKGNDVKVAVFDTGVEMEHSDLEQNIYGEGYDATTAQSPSMIRGNHGTECAGIIGAIQNNVTGISGVAPECKIISISSNFHKMTTGLEVARGFDWAYENGIEIISNSWGFSRNLEHIKDAVYNVINNGRDGKGCVVVFSSGNENDTNIRFPANEIPEAIVVGAISYCGERKDYKSCDGQNYWGSCYGEQLDIVAPGVFITTTDIGNSYDLEFRGTSAACPHISGIAALMLSVNPCLTAIQVSDIIEQTANSDLLDEHHDFAEYPNRPNGEWNEEVGYGLADAYLAVQMAQEMISSDLDLYIKDSSEDYGFEPNTVTEHMWLSEDIWVRNNDDNGLTHQNPEYRSNGDPNYINVRIRNKSCVASSGNESLIVNWAKANTSLSWPENWDGSLQNSLGFDLGNELTPVSIPVIPANEEVIVKIPWVVPNPDHYSNNENPWHFCLLARIEAEEDPLTFPMTSNPNLMVRNNNNLAWKNLTIVDLIEENTSATVMISNPLNTTGAYSLTFKSDNEIEEAIYNVAEITIEMDEVIYNAWENGGKQSVLLSNKSEANRKLVEGNNAALNNIILNANERGLLTLKLNFLTKKLINKEEFTYHIIQTDVASGEIIGGETFVIKNKSRPKFNANAGEDRLINEVEMITLSAEQINEAAIYNWYDTDGNLIYEGQDLTIIADITKKYKLEVIAESDGYKDYDEVQITFNTNKLETISPNPASNQILVNYKLDNVSSAYLMIIGQYVSNNYILDITSDQITIDISNYTSGFYAVSLVCDGEIVDSKTLIKQ